MLKRLFVGLIIILIVVGCGEKKQPDEKNNKEEYDITKTVEKLTIIIDDITITDHTGNMDSKGNEIENGQHFKVGDDLLLAEDYKQVSIFINYKNDSDNEYNFGVGGWQAFLKESNNDNRVSFITVSGDIIGKVEPNSTGEGLVTAVVNEEELSKEKLILVYDYLDYNSEWQEEMQKVINNEITYSKFKENYKPIRVEFNLNTEEK